MWRVLVKLVHAWHRPYPVVERCARWAPVGYYLRMGLVLNRIDVVLGVNYPQSIARVCALLVLTGWLLPKNGIGFKSN